jgi:SAM-dependent methyltransferase
MECVRRQAIAALEKTRLAVPAFRVYERALALRTRGDVISDDGWPLPPAHLRVLVSGTADSKWFLRGGAREARLIASLLAEVGETPASVQPLLDFGCGCGRVLRHWRGLAQVHGCDFNPVPLGWCERHLPFTFSRNYLDPPLPYPDEEFGLIYAISVLTHLPETEEWLDELHRVVRRGGFLLVTTQGDRYTDKLTATERRRYDVGEVVVRHSVGRGSNLCSVHHPPAYLASAPGFERVVFRAGDREMSQDMSLLRRD